VGETLEDIARRNGCFVNDLRELNPRDKKEERTFQGYTEAGKYGNAASV
jgi:hypothetical protein